MSDWHRVSQKCRQIWQTRDSTRAGKCLKCQGKIMVDTLFVLFQYLLAFRYHGCISFLMNKYSLDLAVWNFFNIPKLEMFLSGHYYKS